MSGKVCTAVGVMALAAALGCGGDDDGSDSDAAPRIDAAASPDAPVPDALDPCSLCTASQDCNGTTCECPANPTIAEPFDPILTQMDTEMEAPDVLGIAAYSPDGSRIDALVVGFHPTDTPVDTNIDLSAVSPGVAPFVGYGYEVDIVGMTTRGTLRSTEGTLRLTDRCNEGVAGTMTDVVVVEVDVSTDPASIVTGGCEFTISSVDFSFGSACP